MEKTFQRALFIFRRDLRLEDNTGLLFALKQAKEVMAAFIFTPEQIIKNSYLSLRCLQFMIESLEDLERSLEKKQGKLYLFYGKPEDVVAQCIETAKIDTVIVNRDYTPYSVKRDAHIATVCKKAKIPFHSFDDALLHTPEETTKADGTPYCIFTPYYRRALLLTVKKPITNSHNNYFIKSLDFSEKKSFYQTILPKRSAQMPGGRSAALNLLKQLKKHSHYSTQRQIPAISGTTHLSAHLKFTTCSAREVYYAIKKNLEDSQELIRSLYWRDFFTSIAYFFPHVFSGAFHPKFEHLRWNNDRHLFDLWCQGMTGFPIVDAGMRELLATGYMHNRVRMIVASFLVKDLHIHWKWGEKYFAQTLIDYDPAVNNGNWQWAASTGCDAQPYFRIFNPWTQAIKFDPQCLYIKQWIPELKSLPPSVIHAWSQIKNHQFCPSYPPPLVDHAKEAKYAIASYKRL